jgi:hypothetical protein
MVLKVNVSLGVLGIVQTRKQLPRDSSQQEKLRKEKLRKEKLSKDGTSLQ